ncbi:MAG: YggS family pyridoxal phosphate-dependent enzyme [Treponema sp.]|jgi:pyridoxal phosphate enzyme (YggS family)|nr:YggS family pyridoxal phosphate-dependent enzyme [Treponema sp.]
MSIAENIARIEERILNACNKAGRKRDEVTLMGVSKFVPVEQIKEAYHAGIRCFGESRVKEAADKFDVLKNEMPCVRLNLIGSLQRNKAKQAALLVDCIQSVDRDELIEELVKYSPLRKEPLEILLELRTGEETKSGYESLEGLFHAAELVMKSDNLKLAGLMTMAPFTTDSDVIRSSFRQLVNAQKELEKRFPPKENWACLSMGMSNDFEIAIQEGSNMLRIGTVIFKEQG